MLYLPVTEATSSATGLPVLGARGCYVQICGTPRQLYMTSKTGLPTG